MKEIEIGRMNFVAKKGMVLDYQHIVMLFVAWVLFLVMISGVQYFRLWYARRSMVVAKTQLAALMQDQERRLAMMQLAGPKVDREKQQDLIAIFRNPPYWSRVLSEVQEHIPMNVSISLMKSIEDAKEGKFRLRIEGESPSMRLIVEFMQRLQISPLFENVALAEAKRVKEKSMFTYALETQVFVTGM